MTQEELDALMQSDVDDIEIPQDEVSQEALEDILGTTEEIPNNEASEDDGEVPLGYNDDTAHHWPLPATNENRMVQQLDDVTKESEEKASQIFDIIEEISNDMMDKEENLSHVLDVLNSNIELFTNLNEKFPEVKTFAQQLERNQKALKDTNEVTEVLQNSGDSIMSVMDIMQYQDIHRQKIERVINVMRSLSRYMNMLFDASLDDDKRVSSAVHIVGDDNDDLASVDDIEALLEQFGK